MLSARIGDMVTGIMMIPPPGVPTPGIGIISSGNPMSLSAGLPEARIGDIVMFPIGPAIIMSGSVTNIGAGMPQARLGDMAVGPLVQGGIITTGNPMELIV